MRNLLITGGAGFIGSNFVRHWNQKYPNDTIIVIDNLTYAGNFDNIRDTKAQPIKGDINDMPLVSDIFKTYQINTVVNFAAESHVDRSIQDSSPFVRSNVMGTHALLNVARHFWLEQWQLKTHRFHHISTDEVFGTLQPNDEPFTESHPYQPNSPYAASKAAADHFVRAFQVTYGLNTTISHCSNNYGPYHYPEKLIPLALVKILNGQPIPIYGDGKQVRDWLHVSDHCRAIDEIICHGNSGDAFNVGGHDGETTNLDLIKLICDCVDETLQVNKTYQQHYPNALIFQKKSSKTLIQHVTDRLGHDRRYAIDSSKLQKKLNFQYKVDLQTGIRDTIRWYLDNPEWWQHALYSAKNETIAPVNP